MTALFFMEGHCNVISQHPTCVSSMSMFHVGQQFACAVSTEDQRSINSKNPVLLTGLRLLIVPIEACPMLKRGCGRPRPGCARWGPQLGGTFTQTDIPGFHGVFLAPGAPDFGQAPPYFPAHLPVGAAIGRKEEGSCTQAASAYLPVASEADRQERPLSTTSLTRPSSRPPPAIPPSANIPHDNRRRLRRLPIHTRLP